MFIRIYIPSGVVNMNKIDRQHNTQETVGSTLMELFNRCAESQRVHYECRNNRYNSHDAQRFTDMQKKAEHKTANNCYHMADNNCNSNDYNSAYCKVISNVIDELLDDYVEQLRKENQNNYSSNGDSVEHRAPMNTEKRAPKKVKVRRVSVKHTYE